METRNLAAGTEFSDVTKEQLISDFKVVVADAEALIKATANQSGQAMTAWRTKAGESLAAAKTKLENAQTAVVEKSKEAAKTTDHYVHENPWKSIGIAAGVGLVIGLLIGRR